MHFGTATVPVATTFLVPCLFPEKHGQVNTAAELATYSGFVEENNVYIFSTNPWPSAVVPLLDGPPTCWACGSLWSGTWTQGPGQTPEPLMGPQSAWPHPPWGLFTIRLPFCPFLALAALGVPSFLGSCLRPHSLSHPHGRNSCRGPVDGLRAGMVLGSPFPAVSQVRLQHFTH